MTFKENLQRAEGGGGGDGNPELHLAGEGLAGTFVLSVISFPFA
jgi:hypothetical protein